MEDRSGPPAGERKLADAKQNFIEAAELNIRGTGGHPGSERMELGRFDEITLGLAIAPGAENASLFQLRKMM
nr:hypothetical protein [Devosia submarina]